MSPRMRLDTGVYNIRLARVGILEKKRAIGSRQTRLHGNFLIRNSKMIPLFRSKSRMRAGFCWTLFEISTVLLSLI